MGDTGIGIWSDDHDGTGYVCIWLVLNEFMVKIYDGNVMMFWHDIP